MSATEEAVKVKRIQRKRTKGFRLPEGTICCTRPGPFGNKFTVGMWFRNISGDWNVWSSGDSPHFGNQQVRDLAHSLELFREYATIKAERNPQWLDPIRKAKFAACWCKETATCHVDIILELANQ